MNIDAHIYKTRDGMWRARITGQGLCRHTIKWHGLRGCMDQARGMINEYEKRINKGSARQGESSE